MKKKKRYGILNIGMGFSILLTSIFFSVASSSYAQRQSPHANPAINQTIFLPLVLRPFHQVTGVETSWITGSLVDKAVGINTAWWRYSAFSWASIEQTNTDPSQYNWGSVNEAGLLAIAQKGIKIIATVKYTPLWAQKYSGFSCGPIAQNNFGDFAQFMQTLVSKYGIPPYNIKYWEIGNEIDVDRTLVSPNSFYGCWGEQSDLNYYGGEYYAEMLKVVYPAIKAIDPSAQIIIGSLLLDCDPTNPPTGKTCLPAKFFEGILHRNGNNDGGNYFDIVGYHGYPVYTPSGKILDENYPSWDARGGIFLGKLDFLREVMAAYNINKPIMNTEVSLLCPEYFTSTCNPPTAAFYQVQADYATWVLVKSIVYGLDAFTWYTLNGDGWRYGGLLNSSQEPKPVYNSFEFITQELSNAVYTGELLQYTDLRAYEFTLSSKRIWVLWAPDQVDHAITVPAGTIQVLDKYGNVVTPNQGQLIVNSPLYIELTP